MGLIQRLEQLPFPVLVLLFVLGGSLLMLGACQINEYHATGRNSSIVLDNGSGTQERGRNNPSALNEPDVSVVP